MNRRRFLELLGSAALGSGIVYSFPSVIVPKNISMLDWKDHLINGITNITDDSVYGFGFTGFQRDVDSPFLFDYSKFIQVEIIKPRLYGFQSE